MLYPIELAPPSGARVKITRYASGNTELGTQADPTYTAMATVVRCDDEGLLFALDQPGPEDTKRDHYELTSAHAYIYTGGRHEWTIESLDVIVINAAIADGLTDLEQLGARLRQVLEAEGCTILTPPAPQCVRSVAFELGTGQVRVLDLLPAKG